MRHIIKPVSGRKKHDSMVSHYTACDWRRISGEMEVNFVKELSQNNLQYFASRNTFYASISACKTAGFNL